MLCIECSHFVQVVSGLFCKFCMHEKCEPLRDGMPLWIPTISPMLRVYIIAGTCAINVDRCFIALLSNSERRVLACVNCLRRGSISTETTEQDYHGIQWTLSIFVYRDQYHPVNWNFNVVSFLTSFKSYRAQIFFTFVISNIFFTNNIVY